MHRALALGRDRPRAHQPEPGGRRGHPRRRRHARRRGRHRAGRRAARRGRRARARPATRRRGRHRGRHPRAVRAHRSHRPVRRRADRGRGRAGRLRRRRPEPRGGRRRRQAARRRRRGGRAASRRTPRPSGALRPVAARDPHRPPVRHLEVRRDPRRAGRGRRRHLAAGSPRPRPAPTCTGCAATVDAIVVGSGTVLADDPHLTVRDARAGSPTTSRCASSSTAGTASGRRPGARRRRRDAGARHRRAAVRAKALYDRGVRHVLLEGGPTLAGAFVEARCVDEVVAYLAPMLLGAGPAALGDAGHRNARRRASRWRSSRSPGSARTSRSVARPTLGRARAPRRRQLGVHRDHRGGRRGRRRRRSAATRPCCTVRGATHRRRPHPRRVDRGQRGLPDRRRLATGAVSVRIDFDVMGETLERSVIGALAAGDPVNLERAVRADARLDGHVVQGHVDGTGVVLSRTPGRRTGRSSGSACPPTWPASSPRRARSPSTASR